MLNDQKFLLSWTFVLLFPHVALGPAAVGPLTLLGLLYFFQFPYLKINQNHLCFLLLILSTLLGVVLIHGEIVQLWLLVFLRIFLCYMGLSFIIALFEKTSDEAKVQIIFLTPILMLFSALIYQSYILTLLPISISGIGFWDLSYRFSANDFVFDAFKIKSMATTSAIGFLLCCLMVLFWRIKKIGIFKIYIFLPLYIIIIYLGLLTGSKFLFLLIILSLAVFPIIMSVIIASLTTFVLYNTSVERIFFLEFYLKNNLKNVYKSRLNLFKNFDFNFNPYFGQPYSLNIQESFYIGSLNFGGVVFVLLALFLSISFSLLLARNLFQFFSFLLVILVLGQIFYILGSEKGLIGLFLIKVFFDLSGYKSTKTLGFTNLIKHKKIKV